MEKKMETTITGLYRGNILRLPPSKFSECQAALLATTQEPAMLSRHPEWPTPTYNVNSDNNGSNNNRSSTSSHNNKSNNNNVIIRIM